MEAVKEPKKTTSIKSRTQSEVNAVRQENWLTQGELAKYLNISDKEVQDLLMDGYFRLSNAMVKADRLIHLESVDEYLKTGTRARSSDSLFAKKQKAKQELRERAEGLKSNITNKINQLSTQLREAKIAVESGKIDKLANDDNINFALIELNKISTKVGL